MPHAPGGAYEARWLLWCVVASVFPCVHAAAPSRIRSSRRCASQDKAWHLSLLVGHSVPGTSVWEPT